MPPSDHTRHEEREVDCAQVHAAMRQGRPSAEVLAHLEACEACRVLSQDSGGLAGALGGLALDSAGLDAVLARVRADLEAETGPVASLRSQPTLVRIALAALGIVVVPAVMLLGSPRVDLGVYPWARLWFDALLFAIPSAAILLLALRPLYRRAPAAWVEPSWIGAAALAMVLLAILPVAHHDHPASLLGVGDDFASRARGCFLTGMLCGVPALLWVRLLERDDRPRWHARAVIGTLAALSGALAVFLHCPVVGSAHLLAGHATVLVPYLLITGITARLRRLRAPA